MKKRFSFCAAHGQPASAASAAALHHRGQPGLLIVDVPPYGHFIAPGTPGAGKSALLRDAESAILYPEMLGSVYRFRTEDNCQEDGDAQ
ncbi:hypothetical protein NH00_05505 [Enterobacter cancerogenus]|nr:hypothetical protein NH00_05505 [Enterobacter cancerogenus]